MIKAYFIPTAKTIVTFMLGVVLSWCLYEGWYYWQVLRWVDNIRITQAIQQAAAQGQQHQSPPPEPHK
jgi:hypothetical protein